MTNNLWNMPDCDDCVRPSIGPGSGYFPNLVVETHLQQKALFYNDLLAGKTVMINFLSIASELDYPVMDNLVRVADLLGDRLGRDVHMYTVTLQPEQDTPRALQHFAQRYRTPPGWLFLTGEPLAIAQIHGRFYAGGAGGGAHHLLQRDRDQTSDCSLGLIRYGNEAVGTWGAVPCRTTPEWIVKRLDWVTPRPAVTGAPRRKGPTPRTALHSE